MYDWSPQASGDGSGYVESKPPKPAVDNPRWTVGSNSVSTTELFVLTSFCLFSLIISINNGTFHHR